MRYLITLLFAALSLNAVGQGIPQLPYNPDATGDEFIGSPDLLELLSLYGEEFSSAILSEDQESAIVYMGEMAHPLCNLACDNLPGFWHMSTMDDLGLVWDDVISTSSDTWVSTQDNSTSYSYFRAEFNRLWSETYPNAINQCYCATHELPKVEYYMFETGNDVATRAQLINEAALDGWRLMPSTESGYGFSTMWRWAE
jgi:hypothetical protein